MSKWWAKATSYWSLRLDKILNSLQTTSTSGMIVKLSLSAESTNSAVTLSAYAILDRTCKFLWRIKKFANHGVLYLHVNRFTVAQQTELSCMKMTQVETFATIPTGGAVRPGLHSVSAGQEFCIASC